MRSYLCKMPLLVNFSLNGNSEIKSFLLLFEFWDRFLLQLTVGFIFLANTHTSLPFRLREM